MISLSAGGRFGDSNHFWNTPFAISMRVVLVALLVASILVATPEGADADPLVYPDLIAVPPTGGTAPVEVTYNGHTMLVVRFDGYVTNIGAGPLDIFGNPSAGTMVQRVKSGDSWVDVASPPVIFETADGHNHWHLMRIARYSLWNENRNAEVAPGQKVGFCLYDVLRVGAPPGSQVYDGNVVHFCEAGNPNATSLRMGISPGWQDLYNADLTFQWVDVSNVAPGRYHLASQIDPDNVVIESDEANNTIAFDDSITVVPGYVASPVGPITIAAGPSVQVTLQSQTFGTPTGARRFKVITPPSHGTLSVPVGTAFTGPNLTYTASPGYSGTDSFSYVALDSASPYPLTPPAATVSLDVIGNPDISVDISGAPAEITVGTGVQLQATVINAAQGVTWSVNGIPGGNSTVGTIDTAGLYRAPALVPAANPVTIRATSSSVEWAYGEVAITVVPGASPPVISKPPTQQNPVGTSVNMRVRANDPDGDPVTFSAVGLPPGLAMSSAGVVSGTPTITGTYSVTVTATDGRNASTAAFAWIITEAGVEIAPIPDVTIDEGETLVVPVDVTSAVPNGYICTLFGPGYATQDPVTDDITLAPGFEDAGVTEITVTATDSNGSEATATFTVLVANVNRPPILGYLPSTTLDEGQVERIDPGASDPDGDPVTISVSGPGFVTVDQSTGEVIAAPGYADAGVHQVTVTGRDPSGAVATSTTTITVVNVNRPPVVPPVPQQTVAEGQVGTLALAATDPDGDPVTIVVAAPPFVTRSGATLTIAPGFSDAGAYTISVTATDSFGAATTRSIGLAVPNTNRAPGIGSPGPRSVAEGASVSIPVVMSDPDGDPVVLEASGAGFVTAGPGGTLTVSPGYEDAGTYSILLTGRDPGGMAGTAAFTLTVTNTNRAPQLSVPASSTVAEGESVSIPISAADPDGDPLSIGVSGPGFVTRSGQSLIVAPGYSDAGTHTVTVTATDGSGASAAATLVVTVVNTNRAPQVTNPGPRTVAEGSVASIAVTVSDPDGDDVDITVTGAPFVSAPAGGAAPGGPGLITVTPGFDDAGVYSITITARDGGGRSAAATFELTVGDVNRPPVLPPLQEVDLAEGAQVSIDVPAYDPDGDPVTISAVGADFVSVQGSRLDITPGLDDDGLYTITVTAVDGRGGTVSGSFSLAVGNVNRPPSVAALGDFDLVAGNGFDIVIAATDPDGDALWFSASGLPQGLAVDGTTGRIHGAPVLGSVGRHDVVVSVSDGSATSSIAFTMFVAAPPNVAPVAVIATGRLPVSAPALLRLDGLHSSDLEHGRLSYAWDLDGDGAFDDSNSPRPIKILTAAGSHVIRLRVTDPAGASSEATLTVSLRAARPDRVIASTPAAPLMTTLGVLPTEAPAGAVASSRPISVLTDVDVRLVLGHLYLL